MLRCASDFCTLTTYSGRCMSYELPGRLLDKQNVKVVYIAFEEYIKITKILSDVKSTNANLPNVLLRARH